MELTLVDTTAMPVVSSISIIYSLSHRCIMITLEHASINPSDIDPETSHQRHTTFLAKCSRLGTMEL